MALCWCASRTKKMTRSATTIPPRLLDDRRVRHGRKGRGKQLQSAAGESVDGGGLGIGPLIGPSVRRNSRCMRSTMGVKASLATSRSVRPNFIPRSSQVAPRRDLGVMRWTITPTKASQPGAVLTASVIVNSSSSVVFETRPSLLHHLLGGAAAVVCSIKG
jgi:hypothetical protein